MLKAGDKAPTFSLPDTNGKTVTLKDYKGKKLVLFFYPKDMTPGCTREACSFRDTIDDIRSRGAEVIGVSADTIQLHQKFSETFGLNFPLLSDESKDIIKAYGVWKRKSFLGKKYMGIVRTTFIIDEKGVIKHIFPNVKVNGHTHEVLQNL